MHAVMALICSKQKLVARASAGIRTIPTRNFLKHCKCDCILNFGREGDIRNGMKHIIRIEATDTMRIVVAVSFGVYHAE